MALARAVAGGKDVRELEVALPRDRGDSFTPASADGVYFDGSKRKAGLDRVDGINENADGAAKKLPARALWRVTETLGHAYVDVLKVDVEGAEFQVIDAWEAYYGCLLYTSPSPRDLSTSRMPSSA